MNFSQSNRPRILNLDKSPKSLTEEEAFYLLNHDRYNTNALGKTTPFPANYPACDLILPGGENYNAGRYRSPLTNESYSFTYNSNDVHFISRINGDGECQIVYSGNCLQLSADPKHAIEPFRVYLHIEKLCSGRHGKYLVWVDGTDTPIGYLDVEASIATDYFTTPFFNVCADPCAPLQLCVPKPCGCVQAEFVPLPLDQAGLPNFITDTGFKFMYRHVYYDGRASEWSDRSTLYYQDTKGCFDSSSGFSRCMRLRIPIGNPLVDKIEVAFTKDGIAWSLSDTIEKYNPYTTTAQYWYERTLAPAVTDTYNADDCTIEYLFCNDKQCESIDAVEVARVFNPMPRGAQGILPINGALGFYNYKKGNCPLDRSEIEKITIQARCSDTVECEPEFATVTVRAVIHNFDHNRNQFIYRNGGTAGGDDDTADTAYFGGLNNEFDGGWEVGYDQQFKDKTRNFIVYVEGTDTWKQMEQKMAGPFFTNTRNQGIINEMSSLSERNRWRRFARHGNFFYQEAQIKVLKGTRGFLRLASHQATNGLGANQDTSTFVYGILDNLYQYKGDGISGYDTNTEEIYFDTCNGDVVTNGAFLIMDNAIDDGGLTQKTTAFYGYVKDANGLPIEKAQIYDGIAFKGLTDHNGFYHFYVYTGGDGEADIQVKGEVDCISDFEMIKQVSALGSPGFNTQVDITVGSQTDRTYTDNFYANIRMLVQDCDGNGVGGIRVAMSGSKYRITGADGYAEFKIRNSPDRNREVQGIVINHHGCFEQDCMGKCNPCTPQSSSSTPPCYYNKPTVVLATAQINKLSALLNNKGLKSNGRYGFAVMAEGKCDQVSAAYELQYLDILSTQEKGKLAFCDFEFFSQNVLLPDWIDCLKILRTSNLNPFELQWLVDKIERTSDGKIKLTIQSLNDYNASYNFKTNTGYQWLKGDRIEFIRNGDGKIFSSSLYGKLNFLTLSPFHDEIISGDENAPADFFNQLLIEDDDSLSTLTVGAVIEIQRSKECATEPVYHEICVTIPVVDGRLLYETGNFQTFDTYYVTRQIGTFPAQIFEHHSPSDFWGEKLTDTGKVHFINKYENEKRYGRNISINSPNQFNYFGDLEKTFDAPEQGDIIAMDIKDGKIILAIGEHDSFLAQTADEFLRVGSDGIVRALPADAIISDAEPKISGVFGCQYQDIGSIFFGDGYAMWVNKKGAWIKHDYAIARDISEGKAQSWFKRRYQEKETANRKQANFLNHYRWATGLNHHTGALHLTLKQFRQEGINNEQAPYIKPNETIMYHPASEDFISFASFTPEGYSYVDLFDNNGCSFIVYLNGVPYIHPINNDVDNEFFGIACDRVIGIALNKFPEKIKVGLALEIQDEQMWFVSKVETEMIRYKSEIPASRVKKDDLVESKWNASFLGNINSSKGLFGSEKPRGYHVKVTFVRDNTIDLQYGTIDTAKQKMYDELDMILFKFMVSEQSGITEIV